MRYFSTRGSQNVLSGGEAILQGISEDGGLFVPESLPNFAWQEHLQSNYCRLAEAILGLFLDDYTENEIHRIVTRAYGELFDSPEVVPLRAVASMGADCHLIELFHGPSLAFKDLALTVLPGLLAAARDRLEPETRLAVLTATSGDTGKAALLGFNGLPGTQIAVFFPQNGVSPLQRLQMLTQAGDNSMVVALNGNFDDAQRGVKNLLGDSALKAELAQAGIRFSSANSINIGRLIPQIVYYFWAYLSMLRGKKIKAGERLDLTVPTGNFGNILAAYYAKHMGLPLGRLIVASNDNRVLADFFKSGAYDRRRELVLTQSPSMDILVSSNLERYLYHISENPERVAGAMKDLQEQGFFTWPEVVNSEIQADFATEAEAFETLAAIYAQCGEVIDPHTAVAASVAIKQMGESPMLVAATASPFKFPEAVLQALDKEPKAELFGSLEQLAELSHKAVPKAIAELEKASIKHRNQCESAEMKAVLQAFLLPGGKR